MITISITLISINRDGGAVPVGSNPNKELTQFLKEGWEIIDTRWSSFGRTLGYLEDSLNQTFGLLVGRVSLAGIYDLDRALRMVHQSIQPVQIVQE